MITNKFQQISVNQAAEIKGGNCPPFRRDNLGETVGCGAAVVVYHIQSAWNSFYNAIKSPGDTGYSW
jgi:hypothetical protein